MKMKLLLVMLLGCFSLTAKNVKLTVNWTFKEVIEGYDHDNKMVVFVDGVEVGQSEVYKQTANATYSVSVPSGDHTIQVKDMAHYEGKWEEHSKANSYSVDAFYSGTLNCTSDFTIDMVFNIDTEMSDIKVTGAKAAKGAAIPLTVSWKYTHVVEGYDYDNRMLVYVDGQLIGTSETFQQSKTGTMVVSVPKGQHNIRVENYAFYEGDWELHSIANDYSIDAIYSEGMTFKKKKRRITLTFDIETVSTEVKVK